MVGITLIQDFHQWLDYMRSGGYFVDDKYHGYKEPRKYPCYIYAPRENDLPAYLYAEDLMTLQARLVPGLWGQRVRLVQFRPAWDRRSEIPGKNYGVGGVSIWFILRGAEGAISFELATKWELPQVEKFHQVVSRTRHDLSHVSCNADPRVVYAHSPKQLAPEDQQSTDECPWILGLCYQTMVGGFFTGDEVYLALKQQGDYGLWAKLEEYYQATFLDKGR